MGETSTLAILIGAAILLFTGIASWRTMLSVFAGGWLMGLLFNAVGANAYCEIPAWQHLIVEVSPSVPSSWPPIPSLRHRPTPASTSSA